jgi:YD repeat-containing protein
MVRTATSEDQPDYWEVLPLTTITDSANRSLTLAYTGTHLTSVTDPINRKVLFAYNDGQGNLTDVTDVNGGITHFAYDANHRMLTMVDPRPDREEDLVPGPDLLPSRR